MITSRINRDKKRRFFHKTLENEILKLKTVNFCDFLTTEERIKNQLKFNNIPKNAFKNRIKNRCVLTSRSHGVYSKYKISRIKLRELTSDSKLIGMKKSSW